MKKIIISISILAAVILTSAITFAVGPSKVLGTAKPSDYNIGITYEDAVKDKKPFIGLFYVDWCTYCKRFMPKYKILSQLYENKYNFVMINAENPEYEKLVKDVSLTGFPSIYIFDPAIDNRIHLNNGVYDDLGKLRLEFDRYLRIRSMIKIK